MHGEDCSESSDQNCELTGTVAVHVGKDPAQKRQESTENVHKTPCSVWAMWWEHNL
jgi:hypothetical protein